MNYTAKAALSLRLLTKFGQDVTRQAFTLTDSGDNYGGPSTAVQADTTRKGALFDFAAGQTFERGTLILANDKRLLLDAEGAVTMTDRYVVGSDTYSVVSIGEINPAGTAVLYDLHLRA